jgi:cell division protein FtsQ
VNTGKAIRKILFISMWLLIASGMIVLLAAAIRKQKNERCKDYAILVKGKTDNFFVDEKDVQQLLLSAMNDKIKDRAITAFNLQRLERLLEDNSWIKDVELYFDNQDVLHITVTEREPVARIFTDDGRSYYLDSTAEHMPLSDKMSARVPVFTDFPAKIISATDSALTNDVRKMALFILNDPFWMSQVAQVDITPERNFEMIPMIGDQVIKLGNGQNIEDKFHRLFVFYKQVLSKTGFNKYKVIDVQYTGQVIASNGSANTTVDSVRVKKNVEKLIQDALIAESDTTVIAKSITNRPAENNSIQTEEQPKPTVSKTNTLVDPNPVKAALSGPEQKISDKKLKDDKKIPKAVMPKRNNQIEN